MKDIGRRDTQPMLSVTYATDDPDWPMATARNSSKGYNRLRAGINRTGMGSPALADSRTVSQNILSEHPCISIGKTVNDTNGPRSCNAIAAESRSETCEQVLTWRTRTGGSQ